MQNDFMNSYNDLLNELEQQLAELVATNNNQLQQIERLTAVNRNLFTERAIEQRERETSQHQQTTERFTHQVVREIQGTKPRARQGMSL